MASNNSMIQYLKTFLNLIKLSGSEDLDIIYDYIVKKKAKESSKLLYLNSIIGLKKKDPKLIQGSLVKIKELRDKLNNDIEKDRGENNITEAQKKAMDKVTYQDLKNFVQILSEKKGRSIKDLENYILIYLMINYPLRNDLQEIQMTHFKKTALNNDKNMLYIPKTSGYAMLVLKNYKTAKKYGDIIIDLDDKISKDIRNLWRKDNDRVYLFETQARKPLSNSGFTHKLNVLFKNKFGVPFGSTVIRKIYLSDKYSKIVQEMKEDTKIMGHDIQTQQKVYINNKNENGDSASKKIHIAKKKKDIS